MISRALALTAVGFALVSCAGTPAPPSQPERFGAPVASSPRDVRPYGQDPCRGPLAPNDWNALGYLPAGRPQTLATGERACEWRGPRNDQFVGITVSPARDILVDTYRTRQFALFQPISVIGLPGTQEQGSADAVSCIVTVGTADGQGFIVDYTDGDLGRDLQADDPCGGARRVAERIVASLPPLPAK
ncbi:DUF3558 domain-containing protein [Actinomycetospora sp. CA-053990]|uniref:DUF3558 domain-containing protein n=1 Tax=Actinomycetospora sp. CA-053990 TaxID=3239891 RepID=UPI003D8AF2F2